MSITLTASSSVTISRNLDPSSSHYFERLNHFAKRSVSGNILSYDSGPTLLHGKLVIKFVSRSEAMALRAWINDVIRFGLKAFAISANSYDDLGLGLGVSITWCKLDSTASTADLIVPRGVGDKWDITIPYVCKLNALGGLAEI
jgi:hypothetical protein